MRLAALGTCATQDVGGGRNAGKSLTSSRTIAASSSGSETFTPLEIVRIGSWRRFTGQSCLFLNPMSDGESSWLMDGITATPGISRTRLRESDTATSREIFNVTWRVRVQDLLLLRQLDFKTIVRHNFLLYQVQKNYQKFYNNNTVSF